MFDGQPASNKLKFSLCFLLFLPLRESGITKEVSSPTVLSPCTNSQKVCVWESLLFLNKIQVKRDFSASSS